MIDIQMVIIFFMALIFLLMAIELEQKHLYWNIGFAFLGALCFLILAIGQLDLQIPMQYWNVTSNKYETGTYTYVSINNIPLTILFLGVFVIVFIYAFYTFLIEIGLIGVSKRGR
jgi:hypothetical protein